MIQIVYKTPSELKSFLEQVSKCLIDQNFQVDLSLDFIEFAHFEIKNDSLENLTSFTKEFIKNNLPINITASLSFSDIYLSIREPSLHLSIQDKYMLKLLSLEENYLEGLRELNILNIPTNNLKILQNRQKEYLNKYGQKDILRWEKGRYKIADFESRVQGNKILKILGGKFESRSYGININNFIIRVKG